MKKVILSVLAITVFVAAAASAQGQKPINMPFKDAKWKPWGPGSPLQVAVLWGDPDKGGDYGRLLKLPAGFVAGRHTHAAEYHGVLIQGIWIHTNEGQPPHELGPGSYVFQPEKQIHNDSCKGPQECIIFTHQDAVADFIEVPATK
jgi:anti-sigma factor ChrR (cupin superfamily)